MKEKEKQKQKEEQAHGLGINEMSSKCGSHKLEDKYITV